MGADAKSGYEVGYGKPPLHSRFKPGNRANPYGRPPGKGLMAELLAALDEQAEIEDADGRRRKIARRRLGIARLAEKFATGEPRATRIVLDLLLEIERRAPAEPAVRPPFAAADRKVIASLLARLHRL